MFVSHSRGSYGISSRFPYNFGTASGAQFVVAKDVYQNNINDVSVDWISGNVDILKVKIMKSKLFNSLERNFLIMNFFL